MPFFSSHLLSMIENKLVFYHLWSWSLYCENMAYHNYSMKFCWMSEWWLRCLGRPWWPCLMEMMRGQVLFLAPDLLQDGEGQPIDIQMKSRMDGTYACSYTPVKAIKHTIAVVWGGVNIPHSPFRVGFEVESGHGVKKAQSHGRSGCHALWPRQINGKNPFLMEWPKGHGALECLKGLFLTMVTNSVLLCLSRRTLDYNFLRVLSRSTLGRVAIPRRSKCSGQAWREVAWRQMSLLTSQWTVLRLGKVRGASPM